VEKVLIKGQAHMYPSCTIEKYTDAHFDSVFGVVHMTIEKIYPKYYPRAAVDFFHEHHSEEKMQAQLQNEFTMVLLKGGKLFGVGSLSKNEIKRFFILPEYQGNGYGMLLLAELQKNADSKYDTLTLDSSLGAVAFYRKHGFVYKDYKTISLPDGSCLCYLEMTKTIAGDAR
jgi:GNAT superfamily N-acetyltransferase